MTHQIDYMKLARTLALQESHAFRGWARLGVPVPRHSAIDRWGEFRRQAHTNGASFSEAAA